MQLDPVAYRRLHRLYLASDPYSRSLYRHIRKLLDALEEDPGAARVRRARIKDYWVIRVPSLDGADWVILWQMHSEPIVHYIGPASFA